MRSIVSQRSNGISGLFRVQGLQLLLNKRQVRGFLGAGITDLSRRTLEESVVKDTADPAALGLRIRSLHVLRQIIDGVDVGTRQIITLVPGTSSCCRVGRPAGSPTVLTTRIQCLQWANLSTHSIYKLLKQEEKPGLQNQIQEYTTSHEDENLKHDCHQRRLQRCGGLGGCVGAQHNSSSSLNKNSDGIGVALGRNQPLKREKPKWKSDCLMTDGQLRRKRDEFWDTAPAFEGRKEVWNALKAAAHAFESNDHELARCSDELGNPYQLPVYCLAPPINLIEERSDIEALDIPEPPSNSGRKSQLRLCLSTGKDHKLVGRSTHTVFHVKRRLHSTEGRGEPGRQQWFFSGRPLTDKMKPEELKIPKDYVAQVIVSQPVQNPTPVEN
ncbi:LOW QUALITY PROTEIN: ubiquitin domain-containing protein 2-like [Microtus pennsylvanicus]|uniref:LOW QUALITY PROTEIN: ubiquitin domain-containing protein 2-like n=1 Tax=Microtus pennsylvanicus TaxID=10058 RepID=UPI003F6D650F